MNTLEREAFGSPPLFNSAQRKVYFDFPGAIQRMAESLRTPTTQLCFLLSCGYFKAAKRFFPVRTFRPRDIAYVAERAGIAMGEASLDSYNTQTLARHQASILDFYGFRPFKPYGRPLLVQEIARLVRSQLKPKLILWRCVDVLIREKVEIPGYFRFAALILTAVNSHNRTLVTTIEGALAKETRELLDTLLIQEPGDEGTPSGKTTPSNWSEVGLYDRIQPVLGVLALTREGTRYFAHSVKAFGQIPKSLFILHLIDDPALRQAIEKQLDRIEHAHRFTRAVSVGNPREFLQAEKEDQEMAEGCKRLIKNCIICWNYLYLSQKLAETENATSREAFLEAVAHGSAVSWGHINLLGEYDFW